MLGEAMVDADDAPPPGPLDVMTEYRLLAVSSGHQVHIVRSLEAPRRRIRRAQRLWC